MGLTKKHIKYWTERQIDWVSHYWNPEHPHRDLIIEVLKKDPPGSVCEIGCAAGANLYRIRKEWPNTRIAGCDLNSDAIKTANNIFNGYKPVEAVGQTVRPKEIELSGLVSGSFIKLADPLDLDFKVGGFESIPFHGESYDTVITDAALIYIDPAHIARAFRELRRIGYKRFIFCEFHHKNPLMRLALRLSRGYYAYDYKKILEEHYFKNIEIIKIPKEVWSNEPWATYGHIISCYR